jgi:fucose 4-O-acetylase-like acetyltransferase
MSALDDGRAGSVPLPRPLQRGHAPDVRERTADAAADPQADAGAPGTAGAQPARARRGRIEAIDLARGFAICLMILSHGVNGLLPFDDFTDWGQVPIHLITKFSSSLFIIVFGIALGVIFLPKTHTPDWPRRRNRLLVRGLVVLFWYKVLTVVELYQPGEPDAAIDALLYRSFPSYAEILGFYAIALLWLPFFLPLWARMHAALQWTAPALMALLSWWLLENAGFWGVPQLQALLVEHPDYYTWGQLARGPLVLLGLLLGALVARYYGSVATRMMLSAAIATAALALGAAFLALADQDNMRELLQGIARNEGKHPPGLMFMLFSMSGALGLLALALAGGERLARLLRPVTLIGSDALMAFVFHLAVIFVLFRGVLDYHGNVSYEFALALALGLMAATAVWIQLLRWARGQPGGRSQQVAETPTT